jgi:two-component system response regulator PilR (NtrC family)
LYYRINVIDLSVPPLRDRTDDIPDLARHILARLLGVEAVKKPVLTPDAVLALQKYYFPGNVRELENILERALALYDGNSIEADDLNLPIGSDQNYLDFRDYDPSSCTLEEHLEDIERKAITNALEENKWNKTATAKQLGLTTRSFRYRFKRLGLDEQE